jgi:predicted  nucleic acid-binding Zn-ribbon protein
MVGDYSATAVASLDSPFMLQWPGVAGGIGLFPENNTMSQLDPLYQLQQIDDELRAANRRLQDVLQELQGSKEVENARQQHETSSARLRQARIRQKELELEFGSLTDKLTRSEQRLYSGDVRNPKELADLEHEVAALSRRGGGLEDELLEAMMAAEEAQAEYTGAETRLREAETSWQEQRDALTAERDSLQSTVGARLARREKLVERIGRAFLAAYENVGRRRPHPAVTLLHDGLCQGCGVRASGDVVRGARAGELVYCVSCGRILLLR